MLDECTVELNDIEARINALPSFDKGRQYFTNYALIKACGTVEFVYRSIVADHFSQLTNSRIDTYLDATIRKGSMSAKYDNMHSLLGKFDDKCEYSVFPEPGVRRVRATIPAGQSQCSGRREPVSFPLLLCITTGCAEHGGQGCCAWPPCRLSAFSHEFASHALTNI